MNSLHVSQAQYDSILKLFPESWVDKLRLYTGEELYYAYRLCLFKPYKNRITGDIKSSDVLFLALRTKLIAWLKGERRADSIGILKDVQPIYPQAWAKLGRRWASDFVEEYIFTQPAIEQSEIDRLKEHFNNQRVA